MLESFKKWLFLLLLTSSAGYLMYEAVLYYQVRHLLPVGMTIADLDVSGLTMEQAMELVDKRYMAPIVVYHSDEGINVNPQDIGFVLDIETMRAQAEQQLLEQEEWSAFVSYLLRRPLQPTAIPLSATHDRPTLRHAMEMIATFLDQPARAPQFISGPDTFEHTAGQEGYLTDVEASLPDVEATLYRIERREAHLVILSEPAPPLGIESLSNAIRGILQSFDGMGSIYVLDLQTGEEISINGDIALSGTSILKIGIFVEAYRALSSPPNEVEERLFYETAALSSNYAANSLLHIAAGVNNTYVGADVFTDSMRRLGLVNTFMAVPYDAAVVDHRPYTYETPANSRPDAISGIDPSRQTTAEDIGTLLAMIYYCSKGGGTLLAVYPDQITPQECQAIIDLMILNEEGNLIRFGVPMGTPVSHKHGWVNNTHADAGIIYTPGGDYVLVEYLHRSGDWLVADESFPILREIARIVYNYFNMDDPYLGEAIFEAERFDPDDPFFQTQNDEDDTPGWTIDIQPDPNGSDGENEDEEP